MQESVYAFTRVEHKKDIQTARLTAGEIPLVVEMATHEDKKKGQKEKSLSLTVWVSLAPRVVAAKTDHLGNVTIGATKFDDVNFTVSTRQYTSANEDRLQGRVVVGQFQGRDIGPYIQDNAPYVKRFRVDFQERYTAEILAGTRDLILEFGNNVVVLVGRSRGRE